MQWRRPPDAGSLAAGGMRLAIAGILGFGIAKLNASITINAAAALAVTYLPALLSRDWGIRLSPSLTLWVTTAVLLHAVGMVGPYSEVWWYDHVTHTLSAMLVAAVGYATARAVDKYSDSVFLPPRFMFVYILTFTLAFGVLWEVLEFFARLSAEFFGIEAVLVQYGLHDTIVDLMFDTVGAAIVALFGTETLSDLVDTLHERLEEARPERR
ncbi:hypothetical protein GL213_02450 [Halogeometricum borinquense]|nr:hypothetical protein [Halogeometricum borinquense]QIB75928.1 hypothetical protein G3I44_17560 [Halogeometricum borinquense]QIQ75490.1 hypothetical protein GL213_02450 [Halogeometricum borinquense]RYJ13740.1 hypothetical protein ELS19_07015 [Halogeometricum borinquense]